MFLIINTCGFSQTNQDQIDSNKKEVDKIYSIEENDYLEKWFFNNVKEMKLTETEQAEYYMVLLNHTSNMNRLEKNDKEFTNKDLKQKLVVMVNEMNLQMKDLLTPYQYEIHKKSFDKILWNIYIRNGWSFD